MSDLNCTSIYIIIIFIYFMLTESCSLDGSKGLLLYLSYVPIGLVRELSKGCTMPCTF